MAQKNGQWRFKRFAQERHGKQRPFFVMSRVTPNPDNEDFEASTLDVTISCGHSSWSATGLKRPITTKFEDCLQKIVDTLQDVDENSKSEYRLAMTDKTGKLQIICQWKLKTEPNYKRHQPYELHEDAEDSASTQIFDTIAKGVATAQKEQKKIERSTDNYKKAAERAHSLLREASEKQLTAKQDYYTKVAMLLNEKKKKIRELQQELNELKGISNEAEEEEPQAEEPPQASIQDGGHSEVETDNGRGSPAASHYSSDEKDEAGDAAMEAETDIGEDDPMDADNADSDGLDSSKKKGKGKAKMKT